MSENILLSCRQSAPLWLHPPSNWLRPPGLSFTERRGQSGERWKWRAVTLMPCGACRGPAVRLLTSTALLVSQRVSASLKCFFALQPNWPSSGSSPHMAARTLAARMWCGCERKRSRAPRRVFAQIKDMHNNSKNKNQGANLELEVKCCPHFHSQRLQ